MKNNKLLNILLATPIAFTTITPLVAMTSCGQTSLLEQLEKTTIEEFKGLCNYPHSSDKFLHRVPYESNVMKISNYLVEKASAFTMNPIHQDKFGNIWFDVDANDESLVNVPTIALQSHIDMVFTYDPNQYPKGEEPDPATTKIEVVEDVKDGKRIIHSKDYKTTIGADDGIGVATILALLSSREVKHGKLRIIFTNCEENAMQGAMLMVKGYTDEQEGGKFTTSATAPAILRNINYVLNLDGGIGDKTQTSTSLCVACSGATGGYYYPAEAYEAITPTKTNKYEIKISGFDGGHSGGAVREYKGNAIKAAVETLHELDSTFASFELNYISTPGTTVYNRVPSDCTMVISTDKSSTEIETAFASVIAKHGTSAQKKWVDGSKATIKVSTTDIAQVISAQNSTKILTLLNALDYGRDEDYEIQGIKSSANIGPANFNIASNIGEFTLETYSRADTDERVAKYEEANKTAAGSNFGFIPTSFPAWKDETNRKLYNLTSKYLKEVLGFQTIEEEKAHGGIEPAAWAYAMRQNCHNYNGNCVSIGVNVSDEHEVTETIDVETIQPCLDIVMKILANANDLK